MSSPPLPPFLLSCMYCDELLFSHPSLHPVIQALQVHAGAEEEPAGLARKREHPRLVGAVSGAGDQRDDRVGHAEKHQVLAFIKTQTGEIQNVPASHYLYDSIYFFPLQVWKDHSDPSVHSGRLIKWSSRAGGQHHLYPTTPHFCHLCGSESGSGACRVSGKLCGIPDPPGECQGMGTFNTYM